MLESSMCYTDVQGLALIKQVLDKIEVPFFFTTFFFYVYSFSFVTQGTNSKQLLQKTLFAQKGKDIVFLQQVTSFLKTGT